MILLSKEQKIFVMKIADVDYEDKDNASIESICVGNDYEPVIKFKDGSKVVFDWKEISGAAIVFKEQEENKGNKRMHVHMNPNATEQDEREWEIFLVNLYVESLINENLNEKNTKEMTRIAKILSDKYLGWEKNV